MATKVTALKKKDSSDDSVHPKGSFENDVIQCIMDYLDETALVKRPRILQNRRNWDSYFLRGDFSNKVDGQSTEYLPKNANAVEQVTALMNATLTNFDKWFAVEYAGRDEHPLFTSHVVKELMLLYLSKAKIKVVLSDGVKIGINEGEVTIKRVGVMVPKLRFRAKGEKLREITTFEWALEFSVVCGEDWYPDAYSYGGKRLFEIHQISSDMFSVLGSCKSEEYPEGLYDKDLVEKLTSHEDLEIEQRKARNRGENTYNRRTARRKPILLHAFVGTLLDRDGRIMKDPETKEELKNIVATVANKTVLIQKPIPNPRWDGSSGFNSAPILRTPFAAFSKALADAGERLNVSINELFNLMLDGGMSAVHGIKQIRASWLENPGQISKGIPPGTTLVLREDFPLGQSVMERVDTGGITPDVLSFFNILVGTHTESMLTNEIRLGQVPSGRPTATSIVQSSQALTGIFDSIAKEFEVALVEPLLLGTWHDILQNIDEFPIEDLERIAGPERAQAIQAMTRQQRFALGFEGFKFVAKGLSSMTERLKDFQRLAQFLSVLGANQPLFQEFTKEYSMPRLLAKFMHALSIDHEEIKLTPEEIKRKQELDSMIQAYVQRAQIENGQKGGGEESTNGRAAALPQENGAPSSDEGQGIPPETESGQGAGMVG